jgi:hypothetical protein
MKGLLEGSLAFWQPLVLSVPLLFALLRPLVTVGETHGTDRHPGPEWGGGKGKGQG